MMGLLRSWLGARGTAHLDTELAAARAAVSQWKGAAAGARASAGRAQRRVPATEALRVLLPPRVETARRRAAQDASRARHASWVQDVESYRHAVKAASEPSDEAFEVTIGGISWWAPASERQPDRADRVRGQNLPLRALLQTREVSVGPVMIDIGANIGRTSILRTVLGECSRAYALEPDPGNFGSLVRTLVANGLTGLVLPEQCAIGSEDGTVMLRRAKYIGGHAVRPHLRAGVDTIAVPSRRLDSWIADRRIDLADVHFVKVDVQGWEPHVIDGAPHVLACPHIAWQIEFDPPLLRAAGATPEGLIERLERHFGYFIDLHAEAEGSRLRPIGELRGSLGYLEDGRSHKTDLVLIAG